jgi:uncharacterized protein with PQ loop repeat
MNIDSICEFLFTIGSILFLIKYFPQIIRNFQIRNTESQSISSNVIVLIASFLTMLGMWYQGMMFATVTLIVQCYLTVILLGQIIFWRDVS